MTDEHTLQADDEQFEHAISHAQMMWRLSYKHEVNKRNLAMAKSEAQANIAMASTAEQIKQDNIRAANISHQFALSEEKKRKNWLFWRRVMHIATFFAFVAIIIRFWG